MGKRRNKDSRKDQVKVKISFFDDSPLWEIGGILRASKIRPCIKGVFHIFIVGGGVFTIWEFRWIYKNLGAALFPLIRSQQNLI